MNKKEMISSELKNALDGVFGNPIKSIASGEKKASSANAKMLMLSLINSIKGKVGGLTNIEMIQACGDIRVSSVDVNNDSDLARALLTKFVANIEAYQPNPDPD